MPSKLEALEASLKTRSLVRCRLPLAGCLPFGTALCKERAPWAFNCGLLLDFSSKSRGELVGGVQTAKLMLRATVQGRDRNAAK